MRPVAGNAVDAPLVERFDFEERSRSARKPAASKNACATPRSSPSSGAYVDSSMRRPSPKRASAVDPNVA